MKLMGQEKFSGFVSSELPFVPNYRDLRYEHWLAQHFYLCTDSQ